MDITLIQVPWDSGHFNKRMGKGPIHLVDQGLGKYLEGDNNSVELIELKVSENFITETGAAKDLNVQLSKIVNKVRGKSRFPIILAGNCNIALGTVAGLRLNQPGIIWFDAHGDFNTPETSPSGFFDGMALSVLTGNSWEQWCKTIPEFATVNEEHVILIGARNFDVQEQELLNSSAITLISVSDIRDNPNTVLIKPLQALSKYSDEVYLHMDLDIVDPNQLKANEFFAEPGLVLHEIEKILKEICIKFKVGVISFTSYDPRFDADNQGYKIVKSILDTVLPTIQL